MSYTTPLTAVANASLTAAQWNASVRDNFAATAVAVTTAAGQYTVGTAAQTLAARHLATGSVSTGETTSSTTWANLATVGPAVTVVTGVDVIEFISAGLSQSTVPNADYAGVNITGATTISPFSSGALQFVPTSTVQSAQCSQVTQQGGLTAGSNTFTMQYQVGGGTGTFSNRRLTVLPF